MADNLEVNERTVDFDVNVEDLIPLEYLAW
jgi:hypothetical protein